MIGRYAIAAAAIGAVMMGAAGAADPTMPERYRPEEPPGAIYIAPPPPKDFLQLDIDALANRVAALEARFAQFEAAASR